MQMFNLDLFNDARAAVKSDLFKCSHRVHVIHPVIIVVLLNALWISLSPPPPPHSTLSTQDCNERAIRSTHKNHASVTRAYVRMHTRTHVHPYKWKRERTFEIITRSARLAARHNRALARSTGIDYPATFISSVASERVNPRRVMRVCREDPIESVIISDVPVYYRVEWSRRGIYRCVK